MAQIGQVAGTNERAVAWAEGGRECACAKGTFTDLPLPMVQHIGDADDVAVLARATALHLSHSAHTSFNGYNRRRSVARPVARPQRADQRMRK